MPPTSKILVSLSYPRCAIFFRPPRVCVDIPCFRGLGDAAVPYILPVAPVACQVILEPGIGQFREFEPRRVHTRINSLGLFLVHKLTCGNRESVS